MLGLEVDEVGLRRVQRFDIREQGEAAGDRAGPAAGHRVRAHHRSSGLVQPVMAAARLCPSLIPHRRLVPHNRLIPHRWARRPAEAAWTGSGRRV